MDNELVTDSLPKHREDGGKNRRPPVRYTDRFEESFPYYLSIGMTPEQYWDEDSTLVKAYRKAQEMRLDTKNRFLWLQGAYVYDALIAVSPAYRAFKPSRPKPYLDEPYPLNEKQSMERQQREERKKTEELKARFRATVENMNRQFLGKKRGDTDGGHGSP